MANRQQQLGLILDKSTLQWADQMAERLDVSRSAVIKTAIAITLESPKTLAHHILNLMETDAKTEETQVRTTAVMSNDDLDAVDLMAKKIHMSRNGLTNTMLDTVRCWKETELTRRLLTKSV